jgi:DNA-binding winged helix-turn-helix (wHTH) protein
MNDHSNLPPQEVLSFGPFSLCVAERLLKKADEPIPLGGRALDVLIALAERAGEVVPHKKLISTVWRGMTVEEANLRAHVAAVRKALGDGRFWDEKSAFYAFALDGDKNVLQFTGAPL